MPRKTKAPDIASIYKEFYNCIDKPGFIPIIQCASKIFNAPIVFTDDKYNLISLYPVKKINDAVYDTLLEAGTLPLETITAFHEAYLNKPGKRYDPFFEKDGLVKDSPRIFAEIYDKEKILGHIAIFINAKKVQPWQLEAATILTDTLRIKMTLTKDLAATPSRNLNYLLNKNSSNGTRAMAISNISQGYNGTGVLLVAPMDQSKAQQAIISVALNHILNKFPYVVPTIYNNDLVILLTNKKNQPFTSLESDSKAIADFLSQYKTVCGAVYPVDSLYLLPNYYLQGRLTALIKLREGMEVPLTYYDEVIPDPIYLFLSQHHESLGFIHPILKNLKNYDKENDLEFFQTLQCYCNCMFQKKETSQKLHIHRNTLMYRLNRIEELFSINLEDPKTMHHLLISFELDKFLNI